MDSNNIAVWFLGIGFLTVIVGFFTYLLAEKGFFTIFSAQSGDKKIGFQTGKAESNLNNQHM